MPFYVGKGCGKRAWSKGGRNKHWHNIVAKYGVEVRMLSPWATNVEASEHERFLIATFRGMGAGLCNITDGGEGALGRRQTEEAKARISAAKKGRRLSPEHVAKISAYMRGRPKTEQQKAKMSAARKGSKKSPEEIEAYLPALRAAMASPDVRAKIAAAAVGRVASPEARAKMSASRTGRVQPPEERAKRSASLKKYHATKREKQ
jgi:hypothetical protein